jgi:hypothetical protein
MLVMFLLAAASLASAADTAAPPGARFGLKTPTPEQALAVSAPDVAKLAAEDVDARGKSRPWRYGVQRRVDATAFRAGRTDVGNWQTLPDGRHAWRLRIDAPGARSIDLELSRMFLPQGAQLWLSDLEGTVVRGPWTDADNTKDGRFWTPVVPGDSALLELVAEPTQRDAVELVLGAVTYAYRDIFSPDAGADVASKSGSCNVDSICPAGDPYRSQIRAVARYTIVSSAGTGLCTGSLINNTQQDNRRLFVTAGHCLLDNGQPGSIVAYWKYENPTCRTPGSGASGTPIPTAGNSIVQTGGSTLLATDLPTDFTLVELNTAIPAGVDPFWLGWDRRDVAPSSAAVIHHPAGHEKRISLETDPLVVNTSGINFGVYVVPAGNSLTVTDWNLGTTEGGSSGSALLNPDLRAVGFLSGGSALCGNDLEDNFARLFKSWDGAGSSTSRLRDHLDPAGTQTQTLDGKSDCTPPALTFTAPGSAAAGARFTLTGSATGTGPFTFRWDPDGDSIVDRETANVATSSQLELRFPAARSVNARLTVADATGCAVTAQRAITVTGPDITAESVGAPMEVCGGDGDNVVEPGERWRQTVRLTNNGAQPITDGYAIFRRATAATGAGGDTFGYRVLDDTTGSCPYGFNAVDISGDAALALTPSGTTGAEDDGRTTAPQAVGTGGFNFYGATVTQLVMSTNGYLSTSAADTGGDFDNTCDLAAPDRGSAGGRLNVLHDDLVVQGTAGSGLRRRYFANCPRAADSPGATGGCTVFQWTNMGRFVDGGPPAGAAEFQAVLYDGSFEIVYQYRVADAAGGASASLGIQNAVATDRLQYACNQAGSTSPGRAVCLFHPSSLPGALSPATTTLNAPYATLAALGPGQSATVDASIEIGAGAGNCGRAFGLGYVGTVDNEASTLRARTLLSGTVGGGGTCTAQPGCAAGTNPLLPRDGLYAPTRRFGNGMGSFVIPRQASNATYFGAWFSGERNRNPTWYVVQGPFNAYPGGAEADTQIFRFTQTSANPFAAASAVVGDAQVTFVGNQRFVFTYNLSGDTGAEIEEILYDFPPTTPNRTGAFFSTAEGAWGQILDDHNINGTPDQVAVFYIYGTDNQPRWTLGGAGDINTGPMTQATYRVHCPTCPDFPDFISFPLAAGSITRNFTSVTQGTLSTTIQVSSPPITWTRNNLPIMILSTPAPQ